MPASEFKEKFTDPEEEFTYEVTRYNDIASKSAENYAGLEGTQVNIRMEKMKEYILQHEEPSLNIGPGFGQLERILPPEHRKIALDITMKFLDSLVDVKNMALVYGRAEDMYMFGDNSIPTITTQSTFQVLVNQEAFLREMARILKPSGFFAITIEYHWNYPRKPQTFYAHEPEKIKRYLEEQGLTVIDIKYMNQKGEWCQTIEEGFSMWITGSKPQLLL